MASRALSKGVAVLLTASLIVSPLQTLSAAVESLPAVDAVPSPSVSTLLQTHVETLVYQPWESSLPRLLSAARSDSPAEASTARLALAMVADPGLLGSVKAALPEKAPLQASLASLDRVARRLNKAEGSVPELNRLLGEVRQEIVPSLASGDMGKAGERLNAIFEHAEGGKTEAEPGITFGSLKQLPAAAAPELMLPAAGTRAGQAGWAASVNHIKSAARRGAATERTEQAVAFAAAYLKSNPYAPEVHQTMVGDLDFHRAVRALLVFGPQTVKALAPQVLSLIPAPAVEQLGRVQRDRVIERRALLVTAVASVAGFAVTPIAWTLVPVAFGAVLLSDARRQRSQEKLAKHAKDYLGGHDDLTSFEARRWTAWVRYEDLVTRQFKLRATARRLESNFLGFNTPVDHMVAEGDTFATGIAKLVRHPDAKIAERAKKMLEEHAAADLFEALSLPDSDARGLLMSRLGMHLLILFPEDDFQTPVGRQDWIRTWLKSKLDGTALPEREALLRELSAHVKAQRRLESRVSSPTAKENALVESGADNPGVESRLAPAKAILKAAADLTEAGYEGLVVAAAGFVRDVLKGNLEALEVEVLFLDRGFRRALGEIADGKGAAAPASLAVRGALERGEGAFALDLRRAASVGAYFGAVGLLCATLLIQLPLFLWLGMPTVAAVWSFAGAVLGRVLAELWPERRRLFSSDEKARAAKAAALIEAGKKEP